MVLFETAYLKFKYFKEVILKQVFFTYMKYLHDNVNIERKTNCRLKSLLIMKYFLYKHKAQPKTIHINRLTIQCNSFS